MEKCNTRTIIRSIRFSTSSGVMTPIIRFSDNVKQGLECALRVDDINGGVMIRKSMGEIFVPDENGECNII